MLVNIILQSNQTQLLIVILRIFGFINCNMATVIDGCSQAQHVEYQFQLNRYRLLVPCE